MTSNTNNDNIKEALSPNNNYNSNESKNSNSKKKEQPPQETFYNLCQSLLRFINRKIVKKYVFPNVAQLPKEKRGLDLRANNEWKYYLNKNISEEEKIRDVFKDDYFLSALQKMTNALNEVIDYIELNQKKINMIDVKSRNKEERHNSLSELRNLIDNYLENVDKEENNDMNKSENEEGPLKNINEKINEKISELYTLQKYIDGTVDNNNMNNDNLAKNDESTIKEENVSVFNINNESGEKKEKSSEKKEIDILIQNFRLGKINDSEKSNEKIIQEKKEEIKDEHIFLNKKIERESKTKNGKNKNKKKKSQKKEEKEENEKDESNINEIKDEKIKKLDYPPIKLQTIPILRPKEENININNIEIKEKKKEDDIDEEILQQLLKEELDNSNKKNNVGTNKNKKEVINIDSIPNNNNNDVKSVEEMFQLELKKHFSENQRDKKTKMNMIIKNNIVFNLNDNGILGVKKYNDRITGPYLAGSYKAFQDLSSIDYPRGIDIIYKYKNMLLNYEAIDFSVKEVLEKYLGLNIIKKYEITESENMITKVETECDNKKWGNNSSIKFNILFIDVGHEFNEKIIDELILTKKEFPVKADREKFMNICLFLRLWRRKYKLYYLIPEILDELVKKYITQEKSELTIVLNLFYELFNKMPEFPPDRSNDSIAKQISLMEEIMESIFSKENNQRTEDLKNILFKETEDLNNKKFDEVFKI